MRPQHLVVALFVLSAPAFAACSSASDDGASSSDVAEPITFEASASTKSELGIVTWGAANPTDDEADFSGYDAEGRAVVHVANRTVIVDDHHHHFDYKLTSGSESAHMRIDGTIGDADASGEVRIDLATTDNTFVDSPRAMSVLDHLSQDLDAAEAAGFPSPSSSAPLLTTSLAIEPRSGTVQTGQQTTQTGQQTTKTSCGPIVKKCAMSLYRFVKPLVSCVGVATLAGNSIACVASEGTAFTSCTAVMIAASRPDQVAKSISDCGSGLKDTYDNWKNRTSDMSNECGPLGPAGCLPDTRYVPTTF